MTTTDLTLADQARQMSTAELEAELRTGPRAPASRRQLRARVRAELAQRLRDGLAHVSDTELAELVDHTRPDGDPLERSRVMVLGEVLHKRTRAAARQLGSTELHEALEAVAAPTTWSARIRAWVYIDALAERHEHVHEALAQRREERPELSEEDQVQRAAARVLAALNPRPQAVEGPTRKRLGWLALLRA